MKGCSGFFHRFWHLINRRKMLTADVMSTDLNRCLGTFDLILVGLGHMMGSGVYILTGTVMKNIAGPATFLSYVFGAIAAILSGLCYAQFSVNIPKTGTAYNYVYVIAGELWAFLAGWNLLLEYLISVASVGRALSAYIDALTGGVIANGTEAVVGKVHSTVFGQIDFLAAGCVLLVFIIVAVGVRSTVNANNIMASVNSLVILTFIIAAFVVGNSSNFDASHGGFFPYGASSSFSGAGVLFFAYVGFDAIAVASEEAKDPSKSVPFAICVAIAIASTLYSGAALALSYLVPYYAVDIGAPFPEAFRRYDQHILAYIITIGALFGICCSLLGQAFVLPRAVYAIAADGLIFAPFKYVNSYTKTPLVAVVVSAVLAAILAMTLDIQSLVEMVSIGTLFAMSLMTACLIKLHYMPALDCQFQMDIFDNDSSLNTQVPDDFQSEEKPILKKKPKQNVNSIGELRWKVPGLSRCNSNNVTSVVIILLFVSFTLLAALVVKGHMYITSCEWWAITLVVILTSSSILLFATLLLYEHNKSFTGFSVPLVPWMPVITLFIQLCLMMTLREATWIRLAVWIAVGIIVYFSYGIRKSNIGQEEYNGLEDSAMKSLDKEKCVNDIKTLEGQ